MGKALGVCMLPTYPGNHQLLHYHADGGAELIDQKLKSYLPQAFGTRVTWSSTDTPELNSISERKFRISKADRRKDWEDKAVVGYYIG